MDRIFLDEKASKVFVLLPSREWTLFRTFVFAFAVLFKFIDPFLGFIPGRFTLYLGLLMILSLFSLSGARPSRKASLSFAFLYLLSLVLLVLGESGIPYCVFFAASIYRLGYRKSMRRAFWIGFAALLFTCFVCFAFGINAQYNTLHGSFLENRYGLGFSSPNTPGTLVMLLLALYLCGYGRLDRRGIVLFSVTIATLYLFTKSRTMVFTFLLFALCYFPAIWLTKRKKGWLFFALLPILCTLASFLLGLCFSEGPVNHLLSGRPALFRYYIENRLPVLSSVEDDPSLAGYYLDNLFLVDIYRRTILALFFLFALSFLGFFVLARKVPSSLYRSIALSFLMLMIGSMSESFLATNFNASYVGLIYFLVLSRERGGTLTLLRLCERTGFSPKEVSL